MNIQACRIILVLACSICGPAFAQNADEEDVARQDTRMPGDSVIKEPSRTIYSTRGLKSQPENLEQYQLVTPYIGIEIESSRKRHKGDGRHDRGAGRDEREPQTAEKNRSAEN